ncbi:hypothetical protein BGW41_003976 [Actinomortierella wolfii]|nr:hypothetical protein BGW41_003976 [Actinomortierella wolfii]
MSSMCSTSGHFGMNLVASQSFARMLQHQKLIQPIGNSGYTYVHRHEKYDAPLIRTADTVENALQDAYWIDFYDDFNDRDKVENLIAQHPGIQLRHEFWESMNAITIDVVDAGALKEMLDEVPGIKMVEPVIVHERPETVEPFLPLTAADIQLLSSTSGNENDPSLYDSGVDYHHPALGGCFGPGCKVAYGYDFVGDNGRSPDNDPSSSCDGHGTHVAGIIAANDTMFLGVAPQATLGAYRVFSCRGGTTNDLIIKALLRAAEDGMQVINLSLGGPGGWRQDREASLASKIAKNGTIIVAAMGNEGRMGAFEASSPGVAESLLTVASTENEYKASRYFTVRGTTSSNVKKRSSPLTEDSGVDIDDDSHEYSLKAHKSAAKKHQSLHEERAILYTGDTEMDLEHNTLVQIAPGQSAQVHGDACNPISLNLTGKIALVRRGDCSFVQKANNVQRAGGSGVIFMDNVPSSGFGADTRGTFLKVRTITMDDGIFLLNEIAKQKNPENGIWLQDGKGIKKVRNEEGGYLSDFSSMGPDAQLNPKPDIAAPGGGIWSTFPLKMGGYALESGTSMATPYIVGCVALYLSAHPEIKHTADSIKELFQNNGMPRMTQPKETVKGIASVIRQGAGLINMTAVFDNRVNASPSYISLNDSVRFLKKHNLTLTNSGDQTVTYRAQLAPAVGMLPFTDTMTVAKEPGLITADASATFSDETVEIAPGETATIEVTFEEPEMDPNMYVLYSGYVELVPETPSHAYPTVRVPFTGMYGDYSAVNVVDTNFGIKLIDGHGRLVRAPRSRTHGDLNVTTGAGNDGQIQNPGDLDRSTVDLLGSISDKIIGLPAPGIRDGRPPPGDHNGVPGNNTDPRRPNGPPLGNIIRSTNKDYMVVFRMIIASEMLVVDLVPGNSSDPYSAETLGVIKNGVAKYIPRNDDVEGNVYQVVTWRGEIFDENGNVIPVSSDASNTYRLRVSLLKPFGSVSNDKDFESHLSVPFHL